MIEIAFFVASGFFAGIALCAVMSAAKPHYTQYDDGVSVSLSEKMIDALNKDEPRRVHLGYHDIDSNLKMWYCPHCFDELCPEDDAGKVRYCPECGQRLDWSISEW